MEIIIPDDYPFGHGQSQPFPFRPLGYFDLYEKMVASHLKGVYAQVCNRWVAPLAKWTDGRKCLEIMAGTGLISLALKRKGVKIIATDDYSWIRKGKWQCVLHPVEMNAKEAIKAFDYQILIVSWPPMNSSLHEALLELPKDKLIVFIGEIDGCTACEEFGNHYQLIKDDDLFNQASVNYRSFEPFAHDRLHLGTYKNI